MIKPPMVLVVAGGLPVTGTGVWAIPATYGVTVYPVMGLPPLPGAVHATVADPFPPVALMPVGATGAVGACGVTAFDGAEAGPVPTALVAVTVKV